MEKAIPTRSPHSKGLGSGRPRAGQGTFLDQGWCASTASWGRQLRFGGEAGSKCCKSDDNGAVSKLRSQAEKSALRIRRAEDSPRIQGCSHLPTVHFLQQMNPAPIGTAPSDWHCALNPKPRRFLRAHLLSHLKSHGPFSTACCQLCDATHSLGSESGGPQRFKQRVVQAAEPSKYNCNRARLITIRHSPTETPPNLCQPEPEVWESMVQPDSRSSSEGEIG